MRPNREESWSHFTPRAVGPWDSGLSLPVWRWVPHSASGSSGYDFFSSQSLRFPDLMLPFVSAQTSVLKTWSWPIMMGFPCHLCILTVPILCTLKVCLLSNSCWILVATVLALRGGIVKKYLVNVIIRELGSLSWAWISFLAFSSCVAVRQVVTQKNALVRSQQFNIWWPRTVTQ